MARPITSHSRPRSLRSQSESHPEIVPVRLYDPPMGIDSYHPASRIDPRFSKTAINLRIVDGWLSVKPGTEVVGDAAAAQVIHVQVFTKADGTEIDLRWTTVGIEYNLGAGWIALAGPALVLASTDIISATAWNEGLQFTDGVSGQYFINFSTFSYALIAGAPIARHITTFSGRIVASYISGFPSRIQWSVKGDNTDWAGLGSGFEDLLNSPGGIVDAQRGVFPVSDTQALAVRSGSVWLIEQTEYFDTPFIFNSLYPNVRFDAQRGIVATPRGLFAMGRDDLYHFSVSQAPMRVAQNVKNNFLKDQGAALSFDPSAIQLAWDSEHECVWVYVPIDPVEGTGGMMFHYYVENKAWTQSLYGVRCFALHAETTLAAGLKTRAIFGISNYVVQEKEGLTNEAGEPGSVELGTVSFSLHSGEITPSWPNNRVSCVGVDVEAFTNRDITLTVTLGTTIEEPGSGFIRELFYGLGSMFLSHARTIVEQRNIVSRILSFKANVSARALNIQISSDDAAGLRIQSVTAFCHGVDGPDVQ